MFLKKLLTCYRSSVSAKNLLTPALCLECKPMLNNVQYQIKKYSSNSIENRKIDNVDNPVSVMCSEVLEYLNPSQSSTIIDMTFGTGGHSAQILQTYPNIKIFALDRDPSSYELAQKLANDFPDRLIPLLGRFSELPELLKEHKVLANSIDGFIFDFGCSSLQLSDRNRGFSLTKDGLLDMRMDGNRFPDQPTAADILEVIDELDLIRILRVYGNEQRAKQIARTIIETRDGFRNLKTTKDLCQLIESVVGIFAVDKLNDYFQPGARTFRALRIFVNNELNENFYGIALAQTYLKERAKMITISYNALEDTIVKLHLTGRINDNFNDNKMLLKYSDHSRSYDDANFKDLVTAPWKMMHKHVLTPKQEEMERNPVSRNAKMRVLQKVTRNE